MAATLQVLCPNGRRQNVKINPNTKLLQVRTENIACCYQSSKEKFVSLNVNCCLMSETLQRNNFVVAKLAGVEDHLLSSITSLKFFESSHFVYPQITSFFIHKWTCSSISRFVHIWVNLFIHNKRVIAYFRSSKKSASGRVTFHQKITN